VTAARWAILIEAGTTWDPTLTLRDTTLTGYSARMQIRTPDGQLLEELTTENGKITIDGPAGRIQLLLTDTQTSAYEWDTGVYDLELISPSGHVDRLVQGTVTVNPEVTR
jgi:hypothetical protein